MKMLSNEFSIRHKLGMAYRPSPNGPFRIDHDNITDIWIGVKFHKGQNIINETFPNRLKSNWFDFNVEGLGCLK